MKTITPLEAAKLAVKEIDVAYSPNEFRAILANLIDFIEKPVTLTVYTGGKDA